MNHSSALSVLKEAGLCVTAWTTGPYSGGFSVAKPASTPGNGRPGYEMYWGPDEIRCDAPAVNLYPIHPQWVVKVRECVPGPGPGDFQDQFSSLADAVQSIQDYFFGPSEKMNPPELLKRRNCY